MQKLGRILLFILNIVVDIFLVMVAIVLLLWLFGISPDKSIKNTLMWFENVGNFMRQDDKAEEIQMLSPKYKERAHRNLYVEYPNKRDKNSKKIIVQPYKQD